jgi:hypothetical protein
MPGDAETSERIEGPTPNGGAYSIANFLDAGRAPTTRDRAVFLEIMEYDEDGNMLFRTWMEKGDEAASA